MLAAVAIGNVYKPNSSGDGILVYEAVRDARQSFEFRIRHCEGTAIKYCRWQTLKSHFCEIQMLCHDRRS
jgi:hypothetical protein